MACDGGYSNTACAEVRRRRHAVVQLVTRFGRYGNYDGQFRLAHDIGVRKDGPVYVVDALRQRVQKSVPRLGKS